MLEFSQQLVKANFAKTCQEMSHFFIFIYSWVSAGSQHFSFKAVHQAKDDGHKDTEETAADVRTTGPHRQIMNTPNLDQISGPNRACT